MTTADEKSKPNYIKYSNDTERIIVFLVRGVYRSHYESIDPGDG